MLNRCSAFSGVFAASVIGLMAAFLPPAVAQTIDLSFNPNLGMADVHGIYLGPDNMYYVTGFMSPQVGNGLIVRMDRSGHVDPGFDVILDGLVRDVGFFGNQIVIAGEFSNVNGVFPAGTRRNGIARLNPDGNLDMGFDLSDEAGSNLSITKIQVLANGKVYAESSGFDGSAMRRLNADGSVDAGFNLHPIVHRSSPDDWIVRADGHLLWFGSYSDSDTPPHTWGPPFSEFDYNGNLVDTLEKPDHVYSVAPRQDGGLVALGHFDKTPNPGPEDPVSYIAKYSDSVVRDWSFIPDDLRYASLWEAAGLIDGRVMFIGRYRWVDEDQSTISNRLGRMLTDGSQDPAWDEPIFLPKSSMMRALLVEADGTILVGGDFTNVNGTGQYGIVKFLVDDVVDPNLVFEDSFEAR